MKTLETADSIIRKTTLPSGAIVLTEEMPHVRTVAFAAYLKQGSRDESLSENGLSHLLEHFVFRGTLARSGQTSSARSAREIAVETDLLGGDLEAWTDRELTCYSVEVAAELLARAVSLVCDLVARPALDAVELERERGVIREEIKGYEEAPDELAFDLSSRLCWPKHPLGRSVQGTTRSLDSFTAEGVRAFWQSKHSGANFLICAAGRLEHDEVVELVTEGLAGLPATARPSGKPAGPPVPGLRVVRRRRLEQAQIVLSLPGLSTHDPRRTALAVMCTLLGAGMSSRLWTRIREDEGLAYDLSLAHESFRDCGRLAFHAVASPANIPRILDIVEEEARALGREPAPAEEIDRSRQGLRASLVLGSESPGDRLGDLAWGELVLGRHVHMEERLARIDAVTAADVHALAAELLAEPRHNLVAVTPEPLPDTVLMKSSAPLL